MNSKDPYINKDGVLISKLGNFNYDELRQADTDKNGIISLNELKSCKNKTEFMEKLEFAMKAFNDNPNRDYTKKLYEEWI